MPPFLCPLHNHLYLEKAVVINLRQYKIKLNVASAKMFEQLTGKSFFDMCEEDSLYLAYSLLIANNRELNFTYNTFLLLLKEKKIQDWIVDEINSITKFNEQFKFVKKHEKIAEEGDEEPESPGTVTDFANALIITFGMDPHYVNYEMELFELEDYFFAAESKRRAELEDKRLFTYLTMLPHLDPKKKITPEEILPFPWEKEAKAANAAKDLEDMQAAILATFQQMNGGQENG